MTDTLRNYGGGGGSRTHVRNYREQPTDATKPAVPAVIKGKPHVLRKYSLFFAVEAENVINHVNLGTPVGTLGSPLFGKSLSLSGSAGNTNANRIINFDLFVRF